MDRPNEAEDDEEALAKWDKKAMFAVHMMKLSVKDDILSYLMDVKTPKKAWETLKNIYESKSTLRQIALRSELTNTKRNKGETATDFIKRVKDFQQLVAVGDKMRDNELSTIIIHGLKEGYEGRFLGMTIKDKQL